MPTTTAWCTICLQAEYDQDFKTLKKALIFAPIMKAPYWTKLFKLVCDAIDFSIGFFLGQMHDKVLTINYANKILIEA